jgi:hypothetical protein
LWSSSSAETEDRNTLVCLYGGAEIELWWLCCCVGHGAQKEEDGWTEAGGGRERLEFRIGSDAYWYHVGIISLAFSIPLCFVIYNESFHNNFLYNHD